MAAPGTSSCRPAWDLAEAPALASCSSGLLLDSHSLALPHHGPGAHGAGGHGHGHEGHALGGRLPPRRRRARALQAGLHAEGGRPLRESVLQRPPGGEGASLLDAAGAWARGVARRVGGALQPQGVTHNDDSPLERALNVITSMPFLAIGAREYGKRRTREGRTHAASMVAVGATATLYHASSGQARDWLRKLDYWVIACSSVAMVRALFPERPLLGRVAAASLVAAPFRPFLISSLHAGLASAEFARLAASPQGEPLRGDFAVHASAATLGMACFAAEDALIDRGVPGVHAAWHCLAAAAAAATGPAVRSKELEGLRAAAGRRRRAGLHCSANSLAGIGEGKPC